MTEVRRKASEDKPDVTISVDGVPYPLRIDEVTGTVVARLRRESGVAWTTVLAQLNPGAAAQMDLDTFAAAMCVSIWQRGIEADSVGRSTYDEMLAGVSYKSKLSMDFEDAEDDPAEDDPKD